MIQIKTTDKTIEYFYNCTITTPTKRITVHGTASIKNCKNDTPAEEAHKKILENLAETHDVHKSDIHLKQSNRL